MTVTYYHGTTADLGPGLLITAGHKPIHAISRANRVYFTQDPAWALIYAFQAMNAEGWRAPARVYEVRPVAQRTFRDFSLFGGIPCTGRWSCQALEVVRELVLDLKLAERAKRILEQAQPVDNG